MLTFYDEKGNGYGAQVEFTTKNAVNGERSVSGTILSNDKVLSKIDRGWSFDWDGETYKIIYAKPKDEGRSLSVSFDAVHQFFYDFEHSNCYQVFNGSNRFEVYIEAIFKNSGYRYVIEAQANAIRKENFGNAKRLSMFKDIIKAAGLEFSVTGKVVRIVKKVGTDLSTVVRKNFNMNELTLEKNIGNFITYKKGFGAWKDENNHDAGRYETEYESPLARIYGRIEGEPISDDRYKETGKLLERLKHDVDSSYTISVQLEMEDLTRAGYKYTQPRAGDYIMAINEMIEFREKIRIVSYESSYDVTGRLIKHKVTCNDIGTVQKAITSEGSIARSVGQSKEYAESALAIATQALVSADGKNTIYYGAEKPRDQPRGTLHRGDLLYLTVGEETELYFWNGAEWELRKLKFDTAEFEKEINKQFESLYLADINEARNKANQALRTAGTNADLAKEAKRLSERISGDITTFKSDYQADLNGINLRITQTTANNGQMFSAFTSNINGRMAQMASKVDEKVNQADFQSVKETAQLYERILGGAENDVSRNVSRMVLSNQIFQTEVGKYVTDDNNLIVNSLTMDKNTLVGNNNPKASVSVADGIFTIKAQGLTGYNWSGFSLPIYVKKIYKDETYTLGFKFRIRNYPDSTFAFNIKNHGLNKTLLSSDIGKNRPPINEWQEFQKTFTVQEDFVFGEDYNYPFYIYLAKNGWIEFKEPILVRGSRTGTYKPSQFDDAYKMTEATRTQMTLLSNSWSVKALNGPGDVLGAINLNPDGSVKINEGLISVGEKTYIQDGVIKKSMIGKAQIGTAHIGEIDASKANIINISAKNIVTEGLTANIIRGGKLSSLNGQSNFDLQTGWLEMNQAGIGIRNKFAGRPLQYLVFEQGSIHGKDGSYTALMSNSNNKMAMDDGSAGIQIWNAADNTTAINLYGDEIALLYNADDKDGIIINNITNGVSGLGDVQCRNVLLTGYGNHNLKALFNDIYKNLRILHQNKQSAYNYSYSMYGPI